MNNKKRISSLLIVLSLFLGSISINTINATETVTQQEIFEYIVKSSNGIKPGDDVELTQEHYEEVGVVNTRFEYVETPGAPIQAVYYLNDLSLLKQLPSLHTLEIHVPTVSGAFEYDVNELKNLPFSSLHLGLKTERELSDEEKKAVHENQRYVLDHLDPQEEISVFLNEYGLLDTESLIGFDMKPNIGYIETVDIEIDAIMLYADYEPSHEENGIKYYKVNYENPFAKYVKLNDEAIIVEDISGEDTRWEVSLTDQDLEPKFYDKNGVVIPGNELNNTYSAHGVASMDVYIDADKIDTLINKYLEDITFVSEGIFKNTLYLMSLEEDLAAATEPNHIAELEEEVARTKKYIVDGEKELEDLKANRGTMSTKVVDFNIIQESKVLGGSHEFTSTQNFDGVLVFPEVDSETHTVTFETNGGTVFPQLRDVLHGAKISEPMNPSKGDKVFLGWFKEASLENKWDFDNDTVTQDITLYAKWDEVLYDVNFDSMGGSSVAPQRVEENDFVEEPADPTYGDKVFEGWYTTNTHATKWNFATDAVTGDMTLYAKWSDPVVSYTVDFDSMGGSSVDPQTVIENDFVEEPADPTYGDKVFEGWYTTNTHATKWNFATDAVTGDMTLYAKWSDAVIPVISYVVDFDSVGGSSVASQTVDENDYVVKPANPTYDNKIFEGWYTTNTYTTKWSFETDVVTEDMTLYAKWSEPVTPINKYHVTFNSNGGSSVAPYGNVEANTKILKPTDPTYNNFVFEGWYRDNGTFNNLWNFDKDVVTENTILYAKWKATGTNPVVPEEPEVPVTPQPEKPEDKTPPTGIAINGILYVLIIIAGSITINLASKKRKYK